MANNKIPQGRWEYLIKKYMNNTCSKKELDELLTAAEQEHNKKELAEAFRKYWKKPGNGDPKKNSAE